jgi:hypothetical protein
MGASSLANASESREQGPREEQGPRQTFCYHLEPGCREGPYRSSEDKAVPLKNSTRKLLHSIRFFKMMQAAKRQRRGAIVPNSEAYDECVFAALLCSDLLSGQAGNAKGEGASSILAKHSLGREAEGETTEHRSPPADNARERRPIHENAGCGEIAQSTLLYMSKNLFEQSVAEEDRLNATMGLKLQCVVDYAKPEGGQRPHGCQMAEGHCMDTLRSHLLPSEDGSLSLGVRLWGIFPEEVYGHNHERSGCKKRCRNVQDEMEDYSEDATWQGQQHSPPRWCEEADEHDLPSTSSCSPSTSRPNSPPLQVLRSGRFSPKRTKAPWSSGRTLRANSMLRRSPKAVGTVKTTTGLVLRDKVGKMGPIMPKASTSDRTPDHPCAHETA